jgi:hypothetical protein
VEYIVNTGEKNHKNEILTLESKQERKCGHSVSGGSAGNSFFHNYIAITMNMDLTENSDVSVLSELHKRSSFNES